MIYEMTENSTLVESDNLIHLDDDMNHINEFDPLAPATKVSRTVVKKPARPPPPPPNRPVTPQRSKTISTTSELSSNLVNLDFNVDPVVNQPTSNNEDVFSQPTLERNKASSFKSYLPDNHDASNSNSMPGYSPEQSSSTLINFNSFDGATGHNQIASKLLGQREELMQLFMAKRQDDYTSRKSFKIFAGTWNVNGQYPPESVVQWTACDDSPPDIYVVGFQELDLSKEAFVFAESSREDEWVKVVTRSLHPSSKYVLVKKVRLVGMMLLMFASERHRRHITRVVSHQVGTGLLGKMGNKGGVGIRFNIHNSTMCVVNSHLAAHTEQTQRRNEDYSDICSRMSFPDPDGQAPLTVFHHEVLLWVGDLNYRIDRMQPELVKECLEEGHYKPLKENDQLLCQRREGNAFKNFEEGEIKFRPTYKYNPGTDQWDTSEKCRAPAWCDRVLWKEKSGKNTTSQKSKPTKSMNLLAYRSHETLMISDHKPVSALFAMAVKVVDEKRYRKVYEEEIRRLDRMENDWLPTMTLSHHAIEFNVVKFQKAVERSVELHNTGQTPCHFEFIGKLGDSNFCKAWLTISQPKGFILPGEKLELNFEVYVNKNTAPDLNSGVEKLDDILILHLVGGKDFFITLSGQYSPSCFGTSIEALCRMRTPIQQIPQDQILALSKISAVNPDETECNVLQVPKELWRLLDHLYHNARKQADLFQQPGLHGELQEIQENLDSQLPSTNGNNSLPGSNHSAAEALLIFLEALPEPIIPFSYYNNCVELHNKFDLSRELLKTMSLCHRNVFQYLIAFLQELPNHEEDNGLNSHLIATIFSGLILRPMQRKSGIEARIERQRATTFIENFLIHTVDE